MTEDEPLPPTSPLWDLPNVIITPHVGGQSRLRIDQMTDFFCDNLRRYLAGQPLANLVDKRLGFPVRDVAACAVRMSALVRTYASRPRSLRVRLASQLRAAEPMPGVAATIR